MSDFLNQVNNAPEYASSTPFKKKWRKRLTVIIPGVILLTGIIAAGAYFGRSKSNEAVVNSGLSAPTVKTINLAEAKRQGGEVRASGVVKADSRVDVVALGGGTIRGIYFSVGDPVRANQLLATLYDQTLLTNLNNAQIQHNNSQQSYASLVRLADEVIKQAEQGVSNAEAALESARINYANTGNVQEANKADSFNNAIISYQGYVNTIKSALDQISYLIGAEGDQLPGINDTLSIKNSAALLMARNSYLTAKSNYQKLEAKTSAADTVSNDLNEAVGTLALTKTVIDATIVALDNTITSLNFTESALIAQKGALTTLRAAVVSAQSAAQSAWQSLQNIDLMNKRELDAAQNAVTAAQNQLLQAQKALANAQASKDQQLLGAQNSVNGSQGQLNIVNTQLADLSVKTPISGTVTQKYADIGAELSLGQKIAEISRTDLVKIVIDVTSEDIYKLRLGQEAVINDKLTAAITRISPAADQVSKKVGVKISFYYSNFELIPETFVDVDIAVELGDAQTADAIYIPLKSVIITQTDTYVFVTETDEQGVTHAVRRDVAIGETTGGAVRVLEGLNAEDTLITDGQRAMEGGEIVSISNS